MLLVPFTYNRGAASLEVDTAVLEMSSGLNVPLVAEFSGGSDDRAVNKPLVGGVVNLGEGVVIPAGNGKGGGEADTSEAEEVGHVHEGQSVEH